MKKLIFALLNMKLHKHQTEHFLVFSLEMLVQIAFVHHFGPWDKDFQILVDDRRTIGTDSYGTSIVNNDLEIRVPNAIVMHERVVTKGDTRTRE